LLVPIDCFVNTNFEASGLNFDDKIYISALLQQAALIRGQNVLMDGGLYRLVDSIGVISNLKTTYPDYKIGVIYVFDDKSEIMRHLPKEYEDRGETVAACVDNWNEIASSFGDLVDVFIKVRNPVDPEKQRSLESITIHPESGLNPKISDPPIWNDIANIFAYTNE